MEERDGGGLEERKEAVRVARAGNGEGEAGATLWMRFREGRSVGVIATPDGMGFFYIAACSEDVQSIRHRLAEGG